MEETPIATDRDLIYKNYDIKNTKHIFPTNLSPVILTPKEMGSTNSKRPAHSPYHTLPDTYSGRFTEIYGDTLLDIAPGTAILDLGCSTGETTEEIAEKYPNSVVIGIDRFGDRVESAQKGEKRALYSTMDGFRTNFPDGSFSAVFCNNNLAYVARDISPAHLIEVTRLISPDGYLGISAFSFYIIFRKTQGGNISTYSRSYSRSNHFSLLEEMLTGLNHVGDDATYEESPEAEVKPNRNNLGIEQFLQVSGYNTILPQIRLFQDKYERN